MPSRTHARFRVPFPAGFAMFNLFVAFAFTVMADPVSSVTYAIESSLIALDGDLADLVPTMALVVGTITVVCVTYHQLIRRFPTGGGGPKVLGEAFGEGWAFLPLGALLVDFTLTVAVSSAAGSAAIIAYAPELDDFRLVLALGLAGIVGAIVTLGHLGRVVFATATLFFLALAAIVLVRGLFADPVGDPAPGGGEGAPLLTSAAPLAVLLAMPLGMALATGVEAPADAIAQLGQLRDRGRTLFGLLTVWIMVVIVGGLTIWISVLAVRLGIGIPEEGSTMLAEVARRATGGDGFFAAFQAASALLLIAASASAYVAASGLLRALALHGDDEGGGLVPTRFGLVNRYLVPHWGVIVTMVAAMAIVLPAGADEQVIVKFYAVAVFVSFLAALLGAARLSHRDGNMGALTFNLLGTVLVTFVLILNLTRLDAVVALAATVILGLYLRTAWVRRGRPGGVSEAEAG